MGEHSEDPEGGFELESEGDHGGTRNGDGISMEGAACVGT
jgi:hypothetical protein